MAHGDAREGKWRGNWQVEWVASALHTTLEHGVPSITTADAHTSAASSWPNLRPRQFKWTRPFCRKTKSGFCACAIAFQTQSTVTGNLQLLYIICSWKRVRKLKCTKLEQQIYISGCSFWFPSKFAVALQSINNTNINILYLFLAPNSRYLTYLFWHLEDIKYSSGLSFASVDTGEK